jgi:flagellar motor switch protein FliG
MICNALPEDPITGLRKAAILVVVLGAEVSAEVLRHLSEDEVNSISHEVAQLGPVAHEHVEKVLEECNQMQLAHSYVIKGGMDYARELLMSAFGPEKAIRLLDRLTKAMGSDMATFDALHRADPQQLAKFIHAEHPQTIALVLSHLSASQAAALLFSLPADLRSDVAMRMASLEQISADVVAKIAGVIGQKLKALGEINRETYGGIRAVAEMMNRLDSATSREILEGIETKNPSMVETIRHLMFVFEDLLLIGQEGIKEILARVDKKLLTVALKGTSERLKEHFLQCMSQRGADMLREDMEALGPVKIKEVEAAQQQIIAIVRQLEAEGVISMKGTVGEQYVV